MKFVKDHFTKHHLLHKPHRWFLAFLVSPIHAAEMHYKKKYHLNFIHAKKLFFFDMALLVSILVLIGSTLFWFLYDPTITDLVRIDIDITSHASDDHALRVRSGEHITYTIAYINSSDVTMADPILTFTPPPGFIIEHVETSGVYDKRAQSVAIESLPQKTSGSLTIEGIFWGNVGEEYRMGTALTYTQEGRTIQEQKRGAVITTLYDSTLDTVVDVSDSVLANGSTPVTITLSNPYHHTIPGITVPLELGGGLSIEPLEATAGTTHPTHWSVGDLPEGTSTTLRGMLVSTLSGDLQHTGLSVAPTTHIYNQTYVQKPHTKELEVLHPRIDARAAWADDISSAEPGKAYPLVVTISNTGAADMEDIRISLPLPSAIVDTGRMRGLNAGFFDGDGNFVVNQDHKAHLATLQRGASTAVTFQIPIRWSLQGGTDVGLSLTPQISSGVSGVSNARTIAQPEEGHHPFP